MVKEPHERVEGRAVSMYPAQWKVVDGWARDNGFTVSLALRQIIREWAECKGLDCRLIDSKARYIAQKEEPCQQ